MHCAGLCLPGVRASCRPEPASAMSRESVPEQPVLGARGADRLHASHARGPVASASRLETRCRRSVTCPEH